MILEDGTGLGEAAKVRDNRLHVMSLLEFPIETFSHSGDAYSIVTDFIALTTTASYTGILYLINNTTTDLIIHTEATRNTSTVNALWQMWKNPTTGTLISAGTAITPINLNFASGKSLVSIAKKGADAQTVTDGTLFSQWGSAAYIPTQIVGQGSIILNVGNSYAITCKPTAAGSVGCTLTLWNEPTQR